MSFGDSFDGYCLIYAPFSDSHRKPRFEAELRRVGVKEIALIEARRVDKEDPRLVLYAHAHNPAGRLSLIDAIKTAVRHAAEKGWESMVLMESDVLFRRNFKQLWDDVEPEVKSAEWDLLLLHRRPELLLIETPFKKTRLVPIADNPCNHCTILRKACYAPVQAALDLCLQRGLPADAMYGILSKELNQRLLATSRNLTGQAGGPSSLSTGTFPYNNFYASFRACRSPAEYLLVKTAYSLHKTFRKTLARSGKGPGTTSSDILPESDA